MTVSQLLTEIQELQNKAYYTGDQREAYLEAVKNNQELATARSTAKQSSDIAEVPNSTEAVPRKTVEVAHLGPIHPLLRRHGQDRNPGGPLQSRRTTNVFFVYMESRLQEIPISFLIDREEVNSTRNTTANFSRAWLNRTSSIFFVCCLPK